jgi:hypothetical protein
MVQRREWPSRHTSGRDQRSKAARPGPPEILTQRGIHVLDGVGRLSRGEFSDDGGLALAESDPEAQQRAKAFELVAAPGTLILSNTAPALLALRQETRTIPIVFVQVPSVILISGGADANLCRFGELDREGDRQRP